MVGAKAVRLHTRTVDGIDCLLTFAARTTENGAMTTNICLIKNKNPFLLWLRLCTARTPTPVSRTS